MCLLLYEQKDDAVKIAMKQELRVTSVGNRLKRVHDDVDDDELTLLYPFDADQVSFFAHYLLSLCLLYHHCINFVSSI